MYFQNRAIKSIVGSLYGVPSAPRSHPFKHPLGKAAGASTNLRGWLLHFPNKAKDLQATKHHTSLGTYTSLNGSSMQGLQTLYALQGSGHENGRRACVQGGTREAESETLAREGYVRIGI